jgi:hypothetical protein
LETTGFHGELGRCKTELAEQEYSGTALTLGEVSATSCGGIENGGGNLSFAVGNLVKPKKNCKLLNGRYL